MQEATSEDFGWPAHLKPAPLRFRLAAAHRSLHQSLTFAAVSRRTMARAKSPQERAAARHNWTIWMNAARRVRAGGVSWSPLLPREMPALRIP
jgi:hypothetical protein